MCSSRCFYAFGSSFIHPCAGAVIPLPFVVTQCYSGIRNKKHNSIQGGRSKVLGSVRVRSLIGKQSFAIISNNLFFLQLPPISSLSGLCGTERPETL